MCWPNCIAGSAYLALLNRRSMGGISIRIPHLHQRSMHPPRKHRKTITDMHHLTWSRVTCGRRNIFGMIHHDLSVVIFFQMSMIHPMMVDKLRIYYIYIYMVCMCLITHGKQQLLWDILACVPLHCFVFILYYHYSTGQVPQAWTYQGRLCEAPLFTNQTAKPSHFMSQHEPAIIHQPIVQPIIETIIHQDYANH